MDKAARPSDMRDLPMSDESMSGGTNGAVEGVSQAALERGFIKEPNESDNVHPEFSRGAGQGGFLGRPGGWER
jgi:hypothetical protein